MTDHGDRVLEVALERMFAGSAAAQASSEAAAERILDAWRSGEQGTGLEALGLEATGVEGESEGGGALASGSAVSPAESTPGAVASGPGPGADRGRQQQAIDGHRSAPKGVARTALRVAAGLLVLGGGVALWLSREAPVQGPHLVASREVELYVGELPGIAPEGIERSGGESASAADPVRGEVVRPGQRVVVAGQETVRFVRHGAQTGAEPKASGASWTLDAGPGSAFAWTPGGLRWESGELRLEGTRAPLEVELAAARLSLRPGAVLTAHLPSRGEGESESGSLTLHLEQGAGAIEYAGFDQILEAGGSRELPTDPDAWRRNRAKPLEALCNLLPVRVGPLRVAGPDIWLEQQSEFDQVSRKLSDFLEEDPLLWEVMAERFVADRGAERRDLSPAFVDFLAWESSTRALDVAGRMWMVAPQSFDEEHLSAFACRGGFEFERELRAHLEPGTISLESGVLAAACFARKGDDVGREKLRRYARVEPWRNPSAGMAKWTRTLIAAKALDWLGEPEPWLELGEHLRESVPEALERDPILYVGYSLAVADYVVAAGRDVLLRSPLDVHLAVHFRALEPSLDSRRKVLDALEDLLDRW